jgi:hypothetical protein
MKWWPFKPKPPKTLGTIPGAAVLAGLQATDEEHELFKQGCIRFLERNIPKHKYQEKRLNQLGKILNDALSGYPQYQVYLVLCSARDHIMARMKAQMMEEMKKVQAEPEHEVKIYKN